MLGPPKFEQVKRAGVNGSGVRGTVVFERADQGAHVRLRISGLRPRLPYVAQIQEGTCVGIREGGTRDVQARVAGMLGYIDEPIAFTNSKDAIVSVTVLLQGVSPDRVLSREPAYLDLHPLVENNATLVAR
jgi:hypothetical protein